MRFFLFILLIFLGSCSTDKTVGHDSNIQKIENDSSIQKKEALQLSANDYCDNIDDSLWINVAKYKIKPIVEIEDPEFKETLRISNHTLIFPFNEEEQLFGDHLFIDGKQFVLSDLVTLNNIWDHGKDTLNVNLYISVLKQYSFNNNEFLMIILRLHLCNGLACSVSYPLIYNVEKKQLSVFGVFQTERDLDLFDFGKDNIPDFISRTMIGDPFGKDATGRRFEKFTLKNDGKFDHAKNGEGEHLFLEVIYPNGYQGNCLKKTNWTEK